MLTAIGRLVNLRSAAIAATAAASVPRYGAERGTEGHHQPRVHETAASTHVARAAVVLASGLSCPAGQGEG